MKDFVSETFPFHTPQRHQLQAQMLGAKIHVLAKPPAKNTDEENKTHSKTSLFCSLLDSFFFFFPQSFETPEAQAFLT